MISAKKILLAGRRAPFSIQSGFDADFDGWTPGQNHVWTSLGGRTSAGRIGTAANDGSRTRRTLAASLVHRRKITFSVYVRSASAGAGPRAHIAYRPDDESAWIELAVIATTDQAYRLLSGTIEQRNFQALQFGFRADGDARFDDASITGVPL